MNYASVALAGIATISWHIIRGRKGFSGPPVPQDVDFGEIVVPGMAVVVLNRLRNNDVEYEVNKDI